MLRASTQNEGMIDLGAITNGISTTGITHERELIGFAEAMVGDDEDELARARSDLVAVAGEPATVDAAGVASNFQRMVRIADATGIPLGDRMETISAEVRATLDLEQFLDHRTSST